MNIERIEATVAVPFVQFKLPNFADYREEILQSIKTEAVENEFETLTDSMRTPWHIIKYDAIKWLADQITNAIGKFDSETEGTLTCDEIWGIIYKGKNTHKVHNHYPATWSAVAYIDCPEGNGHTVWPNIGKKVKPMDGTVCIFPGYLDHYVEPSTDDIKRIVVSCNIFANKRRKI